MASPPFSYRKKRHFSKSRPETGHKRREEKVFQHRSLNSIMLRAKMVNKDQ